jgi:hypothetical protein
MSLRQLLKEIINMKKLLLLLLIAPMIGNSQLQGLILEDVIPVNAADYSWGTNDTPNIDNILTVPNGKVWFIMPIQELVYDGNDSYSLYGPMLNFTDNLFGDNWVEFPILYDSSDSMPVGNPRLEAPFLIPSNTKVVFDEDSSLDAYNLWYLIYEYSSSNNTLDGTLAFEEVNNIRLNSPTIYPNPTSSLLALNSDKEYDIEVYDMAGNKVMALRGNTIDMSHLSSATYIVKALDKVENEEVSYKVVKN